MPTPARELSSIDFEAMLGGPLSAVINAQAQAAMTTVDFIKEVGFHPEAQDAFAESGNGSKAKPRDPIYVSFRYPKEVSPYQPATEDKPAQPAKWQDMELKVPILTMLPIPFIRIEETTLDFNVKINSVESRERSSSFKTAASLSASWQANAWWLWKSSVSLKVNTAYQSKSRSGSETRRTYTMKVHIRAVQDEMPAGTEKLLGILETAIASRPVED